MMRPVTVHVAMGTLPAPPVLSFTRGSVILNWTDGTPVDYANPASWDNSGTAGDRLPHRTGRGHRRRRRDRTR